MYNPQLANWRTSPAGNERERHTLNWLSTKFGLPADSSASFTSGGSEASLSAVVATLTHASSEYGENGLRHLAAAPRIYLTKEAHFGYNKIAHMAGLGRRALRIVATDSHLKMDLVDLKRRVAENRRDGFAPLMVIGTAGTTAAGVIDPLPEIGRFCREEGVWFHVDASRVAQSSSCQTSRIISLELNPRIRSRATCISGSLHRWEPGCASAAIVTQSRKPSVRKSPTCRRSLMDLPKTRTRHRHNGAAASSA
jgi:hypothetical protein